MRRWRAADGRVVAELGGGRFAVIAGAKVDRVLVPHDDAIDDDRSLYSFDVAGDALWLRVEVHTYGEDERRQSDRVEQGGLAQLGDDDAPTARDVLVAIDAQAIDARAREDDVAAQIDRGVRAFVVPPALAESRRRLVARVVRWNDEVAIALLALLEELCRAPLPEDVVRALDACARHATFAPERLAPPEPPDEDDDVVLEGRFADAERAIEAAVESQELADANLNAAAYRRAERWLRVAASRCRATGSSPTSRRP